MSFSSFDQPPVYFSVADYRDNDTYALDCTENMLTRNNQIASVNAAIVTRTDGVPVQDGDMTVSAAQVLPVGAVVQLPNGDSNTIVYPGTWITWQGIGGRAGVGYNICWPLVLAKNSSVIYRTVVVTCEVNIG